MPERRLQDDERGLVARLQDRSGTEWDLRGMDLSVLLELQWRGLLRVDNAAFDVLRRAAPSAELDEAARFRRSTIASTALMIEKAK